MNESVSEIAGATASIDGGEPVPATLKLIRQSEVVWTNLPQPDPQWEFTDPAGHYHARDADKKEYPTLEARSEHVDCDGSCGGVCEGEGYTDIRYSCRICGAEIEPGSKEGPHSFVVPGRDDWSVDVDAFLGDRRTVSVRVEVDRDVFFGVAHVGNYTATSDGSTMVATTTLYSGSPLGHRRR